MSYINNQGSNGVPTVPLFPRTIDQAMRLLQAAHKDLAPRDEALRLARIAAFDYHGDRYVQTFCAHAYALSVG